jgi:hypothetical protein
MPQTTKTHTESTTDNRASFDDRMCELTTGIDVLIDHLDKIFDAGLELTRNEGADVMKDCMAAQWIAKRLKDDAHTIWDEFDQDDSQPSIVKFAQAAE